MQTLSFSEWFRADEAVNAEYQEGLLASFLTKRITDAVQKFFADDRRESLPFYLSQLIDGEVKGEGGVFPVPNKIGRIELTPDFHGWKLEMNPASENTFAFAGAGSIGLPYDTTTLKQARGFDDPAVSHMLSRLNDQLVHECSHICTAKIGEDATIKGKPYWQKFEKGSRQFEEARVKYYTDPGEVRAHARQYANIYMKQYGDHFDQTKFEKMAWDLSDSKLYRFVHRLKDKEVQSQFPELSERMNRAYDDFMKTVEYFVGQGQVVFN